MLPLNGNWLPWGGRKGVSDSQSSGLNLSLSHTHRINVCRAILLAFGLTFLLPARGQQIDTSVGAQVSSLFCVKREGISSSDSWASQ